MTNVLLEKILRTPATSEQSRHTSQFVSCCSPIDVVVIRHEDDSIFELFKAEFCFPPPPFGVPEATAVL